MNSHKLNATDALAFILAGKATFTVLKPNTGGRFTYKVNIPAKDTPETAQIWWVKVLNGSDNETAYAYIGFIRKEGLGYVFTHGGNKAAAGVNAPSVVVFTTIFNSMLALGTLSPKLEIWHEGKCGRCGRKLTVPESIENGIGPECARIQAKWSQHIIEKIFL